ncbi:MAG TPA: hypothetical protein VFJ53_02660, partial [Solirubrobacterales bacterium]|nr:hypothetical protein [Solirubrobacterales bacterium]
MIVDSAGDGPDVIPGAPCAAASGSCTLRAALEVTNEAPGSDRVEFDDAVFDGPDAEPIELQAPLPVIARPVTVRDECPPNQFNDIPQRPCVGIDAEGGRAFVVEADEVAIEGVSVTDASTAVDVEGSADEFVARQDWFGLDLAGQAVSNLVG